MCHTSKNSDCNIFGTHHLSDESFSPWLFRRKMGLTRTIPSRCLRDAGTTGRSLSCQKDLPRFTKQIFNLNQGTVWSPQLLWSIPGPQQKGRWPGKGCATFITKIPIRMAILNDFEVYPAFLDNTKAKWSNCHDHPWSNCWSYIPIKYPLGGATETGMACFPPFSHVWNGWSCHNLGGKLKKHLLRWQVPVPNQGSHQCRRRGWVNLSPTIELEVGQLGHLWIPWKRPHDLPHDLPSGELTFCYGTSPFLMGTSTINHHFQ